MSVLRLCTDPPERFKPQCVKEETPKQHQHFWFYWQSQYFVYSKHFEPSSFRRVLIRGSFLVLFFVFFPLKNIYFCASQLCKLFINKKKSILILKAQTSEVEKERQKGKKRKQGGKAQSRPNSNDISMAGSFTFLHDLNLANLNLWFQKYKVTYCEKTGKM